MFVLHANNKGAGQSAHSHSLGSAFVGHYLESIADNLASYKIVIFYLLSIV